MIFPDLPRSHGIKKARIELSRSMTLSRINGFEGAYRPFEEILCYQISKMVSPLYLHMFLFLTWQISEDSTVFAPDRKIKVRLSGNGTKFLRSSSFTLLSYAILVPSGRYLTGPGKYNIHKY